MPFENNLLVRTSVLHLFIRLFPKIRISQRFLSNSEVIFLFFLTVECELPLNRAHGLVRVRAPAGRVETRALIGETDD